jgi:hypothetical protein
VIGRRIEKPPLEGLRDQRKQEESAGNKRCHATDGHGARHDAQQQRPPNGGDSGESTETDDHTRCGHRADEIVA